MDFKIEKAVIDDLDEILELYSHARAFMKENGNESQWGLPSPGKPLWPSKESVIEKINSGVQFNCVAQIDGIKKICATFAYIIGKESVYDTLYDGSWPDDDEYGVIHALASFGIIKGAATYSINWALTQCPNMRIDTHPDNKPMQALLKKNGFTYAGKIWMESVQNDAKMRIAFWKKVK